VSPIGLAAHSRASNYPATTLDDVPSLMQTRMRDRILAGVESPQQYSDAELSTIIRTIFVERLRVSREKLAVQSYSDICKKLWMQVSVDLLEQNVGETETEDSFDRLYEDRLWKFLLDE
jgi:hypothetical protein